MLKYGYFGVFLKFKLKYDVFFGCVIPKPKFQKDAPDSQLSFGGFHSKIGPFPASVETYIGKSS